MQTEGHRNVFYVLEGEEKYQYRMYKKLDEIERILIPYGFVRSHRSCLVNIRYVKKVSNYLMELTTGKINGTFINHSIEKDAILSPVYSC